MITHLRAMINMINIRQLYILLLTFFILSGCDDTSEVNITTINEQSGIARVKVDIGFENFSEVTVSITNPTGNILLKKIASSNGYFEIDRATLQRDALSLSVDTNLVRIALTGGKIKNNNGDYVNITSPLNSFIPLNVIYSENQININPITSLIHDIVEKSDNITIKKLDYVSQKIKTPDIDGNNLVNFRDSFLYDINSNHSDLERSLVHSYLPSFYDDSTRKYSDDIIFDLGMTMPTIEVIGNSYKVNLSKINKENYIYYSLKNDASTMERYSEDIFLNDGDILFYNECDESNICNNLQKAFFDNGDYSLESYPVASTESDDIYTPVADVREELELNNETIRNYEQELESVTKDLDQIVILAENL